MGNAADNPASLLGHQLGRRRISQPLSREVVRQPEPDVPRPLPDIRAGCEVRLAANEVVGLLRQRLIDLGFTSGAPLRLIRRGPKGNLIAVSIRDTTIALRSDEARSLLVTQDVGDGETGRD